MGQKVSPIGLRLGINRDWESKWYAPTKDFAKYLNNDIKIREYLEKELKGCAVASINIERNKKRTNVTINTSKPGIIIGKGGADIEKRKKAESVAMQIENRASFRSVQKRAIRNTMKAGAKGVKIAVSGRLAGAEMARTEFYTEGTVPLHTLRAEIDYANKEADTIYGKIGVKVWIYKGEVLPAKKNGGNNNVNSKKN